MTVFWRAVIVLKSSANPVAVAVQAKSYFSAKKMIVREHGPVRLWWDPPRPIEGDPAEILEVIGVATAREEGYPDPA